MGRKWNKKRKGGHQQEELEFDPPKVQSSRIQSTQSNEKSLVRSDIKNSNPILSEGSQFSVSDFEEEVYKRKVKFSIKQWLLLGMSRIVPHSDKSIFISMKENQVRGPKDKVEKFCNEAEKEIEQMKMKVLKFKYQISSEEVQFEMEKEWRCHIFSGKLLKNVADKIQQKYDIKNQMRNEIEGILNKDGINNLTRFLWVKSDSYEQAYEILLKIHKECAMKFDEDQKTIGSILTEMNSMQKSYRQDQSNNHNSSNSSYQRASQKESQSNSSADYSTIIKNKKKSQLEDSSRTLKNEEKRKYESKKEKQVYERNEERQKKQETRYLQTKSSMKNLKSNFDDNDFTVIQTVKNHSAVYEERGSRNVREERNSRRHEEQDKRMPQRYHDQDRERPPRRGLRQGQERNPRRNNRYSSDDEQDSYETQHRYVPRGNREPRRNIIFTQEYPQQYFSKEHFNNWRRNNKTLKHTDKYVLEINEKFSPEQRITYVEVAFYGDDPKGDIIYAINLYFKFEKLIKIQQEPQIRDKMINKFQCKHNWLTVEYKKIYTREKFPKFEDLRRLAKKDNTAQFMNKNKNITHAFLITGLSLQISSIQNEIAQFFKDVQNTCRKVDIQLKFPHINDFMRRKEVHDLIEEAITEEISRFPQRYKLQKLTPTFDQILAQIDIFGVQDKDVGKVKGQLAERLVELIDHFEYQSEKYSKYKKAFTTVLQKYIIFENSKNGLTLIAKRKNIKDQMASVNKQIDKNFAPTIKQFPVKQKSELTLCKDFLQKQLKQSQFSSVSIRSDEKQTIKIELIGPLIVVQNLFSKLEDYYETIETKIAEYNIQLTQQELQIIEKDKQGQKKIQQDFKIVLKFKYDYKIGAVFVIEPHPQHGIKYPKKFLFFQKEFNFQSLPKNSVFFFRNDKEISSIKQAFILPLKNHVKSQLRSSQPVFFQDKVKQCFFIYGYEAQPQTILSSSKNKSPNDVVNIFMYIPEPYKSTNDFMKEMINSLSKNKDFLSKEFKITFIYKKTADLKKILTFKQGKVAYACKIKRNWYTLQGNKKLFYSDLGNKKIQEAFVNKVTEIELNNEDLNLTSKSHQMDFSNKSMVHIQSGKSFPIKVLPNRITFTLNGKQKTIPDVQFQKILKNKRYLFLEEFVNCDLSIGFYKIDMNKLIQTNLFSNFQRSIGYDQVEVKESQNYELQVSYDVKSTKLGLEYSVENENLVKKAEISIKEFLETKLIKKTKPFQNQFTLDLVQNFSKEAEQQNVSIQIAQDKNSFILKAYNERNIETFLRILSHLAKTSKTQVTYPSQWEPQTQDIQTFIVTPNSQEFNKVQAAFTAKRITELVRIQNKIVFRKFSEEKLFLKELNNGKDVKQMLLYHGTKTTDPKLLYEDKQECFNVNYTSQHNLLGKGIYFAQNSEYSVGYSHHQDQVNTHSMFYCCVLVGQSEKCPGHNGDIRDTSFKDQSKKLRYESMTDFLQGSNVYVVYKNRRAYPLYLIKYRK